MRKAVLWFLVTLFGIGGLFPGTDVEEVFKLPALAAHYVQHLHESAGATDLLEFLAEHYGPQAEQKHQGSHEHDGLPMIKHLDHLGLWVMPELNIQLPSQLMTVVHVAKNGTLQHWCAAYEQAELAQPPRA